MKYKFQLMLVLAIIVLTFSPALSQENKGSGIFGNINEDLTISGYVDTYIAYDNDKGNHLRQFSVAAPYRDEFRINLAMIAFRYSAKHIRGTAVLQFGDIPKLNWPQAPNEYMQFIQEANIGVSPFKNSWIDAGYFLTHIGGEGVIPKYNYFTSVSLCTYYEPIYQSGLKFSYTGKKFYLSLMALNGYNVLADNNENKSFGLQLGFKTNDKLELTFNNITGNEMPSGKIGKTRIYNNLVIKLYPAKKLEAVVCGDICTQEKSAITDSSAQGLMYSGFISLRYRAAKKISLSLRGEIFQDIDAVMSQVYLNSTGEISGLKAFGVTCGVEYNPTDNSYFRLEGRYVSSDKEQKIFYDLNNTRSEVILSGGIEF